MPDELTKEERLALARVDTPAVLERNFAEIAGGFLTAAVVATFALLIIG